MDGLETAMWLWLGGQTVFLLVAWARIETRIGHLANSLRRLWSSHDELHPRQSNPGAREHNGHNHDEEG